jgi:hypothetical protein
MIKRSTCTRGSTRGSHGNSHRGIHLCHSPDSFRVSSGSTSDLSLTFILSQTPNPHSVFKIKETPIASEILQDDNVRCRTITAALSSTKSSWALQFELKKENEKTFWPNYPFPPPVLCVAESKQRKNVSFYKKNRTTSCEDDERKKFWGGTSTLITNSKLEISVGPCVYDPRKVQSKSRFVTCKESEP